MSRDVLKLSSTYQAMVEEGFAMGYDEAVAKGKVKEARRLILRFGGQRLGEPGTETVAAIERISNLDTLESLADRLLTAESWDDLLA